MNKKVLHTLEYDKILKQLAECASSMPGRERCLKLLPSIQIDEVTKETDETASALARIQTYGEISFAGIVPLASSLSRLSLGSTLGIGELLAISDLLRTAGNAKSYGEKRDQLEEIPADSLSDYFMGLSPITNLYTEISRCILGPEEVSDDASPKLKEIRRKMSVANASIHNQLASLTSSARAYLQESLVTMRAGRYCLPVKAEYKSKVPGMVHDQSATGATLFIEPMAIVKLNNSLHELELEEQQEIEVILANLSNFAAAHVEEIKLDEELLTKLDFIFAKARFAKKLKASKPIFSKEPYINLKQARHPLIDPEKVVPIDLPFGDKYNLLVVTGPNTGGKTVSLKTLGLLTLMGQSGLFIPAEEGSCLSVFRQVFADIGDEQSIEQSLSTFSSHMSNTVSILKEADKDCLLLFDELGSGTDPIEGAALAMSILHHLHEKGILTMATTHYSELKTYALTTPGVSNASCEFDVASLSPTYHLLIGVPGKSNAFAISKKLGLSPEIIEDAKNRVEGDNVAMEDVISQLERTRHEMMKEKEELALITAKVKRMEKMADDREAQLNEKKITILNNARKQAEDILRNAKTFADQTISEMNKLKKNSGDKKAMEEIRTRAGKRLSNNSDKIINKKNKDLPTGKRLKPEDIQLEMAVKVRSMNMDGIVKSLPDSKGELSVQIGILHTKVSVKDLMTTHDLPSMPEPKEQRNFTRPHAKSANISPEINLLGMTGDEACAKLDKYLDDAYMAGLSEVRIVHGKGTGALRKAVHAYLKRQSFIKSFDLAEYGEGDAGVTIVKL